MVLPAPGRPGGGEKVPPQPDSSAAERLRPNAQWREPLPSLLLPFHGGGNALFSTPLFASQAEAKDLGGQALQALRIGAPGQTAPLLRGDSAKMKRE